ncbi:carbon-nitrogen hydrolase family protein [Opitutus terrae]|uniref:Nitrilase/cyanide hydratase and apolipoprotein N-acyltransferase n=1 Tax=Opitutus terrae (strain DSM 11246 / JCM 15787 / PB90-1) TaxID=452637 RepID=B1ZRY7_OPITP|nr:carbon-nitrogen hydrolase family protein [Opitutus terrae]ACB74663.1 Nitrilase/cyanide hydratase and apolipoprotein N-acyltransferase [Opitutus terrae PB90-1]
MSAFAIAAAQIASVAGDVSKNIETHARAIRAAAQHGVRVLVFPELSLTGYEPTLAAELAFTRDDPRLAPLAELAREHHLTAIVGAPLAAQPVPHIGAFALSDAASVAVYAKIHLHPGEESHFSPGSTPLVLPWDPHKIGVAICADLTHASHPRACAALGADIYAAGVCLTHRGYDAEAELIAGHAARHRMLAVMANYNRPTGGYDVAGKSAVWSPAGRRLAWADRSADALVIATRVEGHWRGTVVRL